MTPDRSVDCVKQRLNRTAVAARNNDPVMRSRLLDPLSSPSAGAGGVCVTLLLGA